MPEPAVFAVWMIGKQPVACVVAEDMRIEAPSSCSSGFWVGRDRAGQLVSAYPVGDITAVRRLRPDEYDATFGPPPWGFRAEIDRQMKGAFPMVAAKGMEIVE